MTKFYHSCLDSKGVDSSLCVTNVMINRFGIFGQKPQEPADEPSVKEFKDCVEQVKSEHPHLSAGAIDQIALQRFTRSSNSSHKKCQLNKKMEKKRASGSKLSRLLRANKPDPPGDEASIEKHRSLFRRRRTVCHDQDGDHLEPIKREPALNLEESLASIELDSSVLNSRRLTAESDRTKSSEPLSETFEIDEFDTEPNIFSSNKNIRDAEDPDADANAISKHSLNSNQNRKRPSLKLSGRQVSPSFEDSFTSLDERNFTGDFSAWRSRRTSSFSLRTSRRRSSCFSEFSSDSFRADLGDFAAWK
jgi:hypothetical protein